MEQTLDRLGIPLDWSIQDGASALLGGFAKASIYQGVQQLEAGALDDAITSFSAVIDGLALDGAASLPKALAVAHHLRAQAREKKGVAEGAAADRRRAAQIWPEIATELQPRGRSRLAQRLTIVTALAVLVIVVFIMNRNRLLGATVDHNLLAATRLLLLTGASPNTPSNGLTPLSRAAIRRHADMARLLLRSGANPEGRTASGDTALMLASRPGGEDTVRALIEGRADLNARNPRGQTALMEAEFNDCQTISRMLTEAGAIATPEDIERAARARAKHRLQMNTMLFKAVRQNKPAAVLFSIRRGADANARDSLGATPLIAAIERDADACVRALLDAGADPSAKDQLGRTPLSVARERRHAEIAAILQAAGAK
jgi:ankyrin repeat protein